MLRRFVPDKAAPEVVLLAALALNRLAEVASLFRAEFHDEEEDDDEDEEDEEAASGSCCCCSCCC